MEKVQYGLKDSVIEKIKKIFASYPEVEEAILYGSRAKGNFNNGSDIDFVLKGKNLNQGILNKIRWKLDDLLLPYSIDIAIYDTIENSELIGHIKGIGVVFYRKKDV